MVNELLTDCKRVKIDDFFFFTCWLANFDTEPQKQNDDNRSQIRFTSEKLLSWVASKSLPDIGSTSSTSSPTTERGKS